ncbi:mitochondrial carnitine acylcarnitine carrier protein cacl-like [Stylonychia lemnae]|uniref:Mitochondrial carnitine acylcarnitine carrier protein cacl-like n=1 Tax=Stylonychia lemnae TaxID=5949 RepID=A0A078AEE8_STYLE|nr:mitochondrial carnitine acylcarnitine carrier protein cacl-like [Stylonychia lemnae]|eukprot:CDW80211.1 mitochondrial carnitine acylcarnitine carrier protein cacl-like [Stylonychia lemnae]
MQKWSEQKLALKLLNQQPEKLDQPFYQGIYNNHHQVNGQIQYDLTYDPADKRYNRNYDELGFGIKKMKLTEDINMRQQLQLDEASYQKDIFSGQIDYSKGTAICPFRNFQSNDNLNSVLQLIFATYPLTHYMLNDYYKNDINDTHSRYKGRMVIPFIREDVGVPQSDPFEIMRFLIECLHEDLNRIKIKPPTQNDIEIPRTMLNNINFISDEYWTYFKKREDSIFTDLFSGQMYNKSKCLSCQYEKEFFNAYNDITLDVPQDQNNGYPEVYLYDLLYFPLENCDLTVGSKQSTHQSKFLANKYKLYAVLHHSGDQATGHYWNEVLNLNNQLWHKCDDAQVQHRYKHKVKNLSNANIDIISGITAGVVSNVISYPLDTIKIRVQLAKGGEQLRLLPTIHDIYQREGGMLSPVMGRAPISAVLFTAQGFSRRQLQDKDININLKNYLSGFFAGLCYTNIAFVFDLLKTRAQVSKYKTMSYREEIADIYKNEGLKGFTRGYTGMLLRDAPGFGLYFFLFELFKRSANVPTLEKDPDHSKFNVGFRKFMSGGIAGTMTWFAVYPCDTIKSKMQTYEGKERLKLRVAIPSILNKHGLPRLYRGIHIQILRAFPTSASSLLVFESFRNSLIKIRDEE